MVLRKGYPAVYDVDVGLWKICGGIRRLGTCVQILSGSL